MKKSLALFLALLLLLALPTGALAVTASGTDWQETVEDAVRSRTEEVEFPDGVSASELLDLLDSFYDEPEYFYYDYGTYSYYQTDPGTAISLTIHYLPYPEAALQAYEAAVQAALQEALLPGMSDLQKALALHDWLDLHITYDEVSAADASREGDAYTAYGALVNRTAVCQGYSLAYKALLARCGIEAAIASSDAIDHSWNFVRLEGSWYQVDVTWDDPTPDRLGQAEHPFFLLSDEAMLSRDSGSGSLHYGWAPDVVCTDTRYDGDVFWTGLDQPLLFTDASTVWLLRSEGEGSEQTISLVRRDWDSGAETAVNTVFDYWPVWNEEGYYWCGVYSGLCLWDGRIWFNGPDTLYVYDPADGTSETVSLDVGDQYLYGIAADEEGILCRLTTSYQEEGELRIYRAERKGEAGSAPSGGGEAAAPKGEGRTNPFTDVSPSDYFYDAVLWAYDSGVPTGKAADSFAPRDSCSRAEVMTFLWRAAGRPAPSGQENPFADVPETAYYRDAVLWAVEQGITNGTGTDGATGLSLFSPKDPCSYAHILTFLWRAMTGQRTSYSGTWYSDALLWAEVEGLLDSTGFDPAGTPNQQPCPRMDIVEYLFRYSTR